MILRKINRTKEQEEILRYSGKLYIDPEYGVEKPSVTLNYAVFSSKWDIEEVEEDNILKIIHRDTGDSISLSFDNIMERIEFVKNIYASRPVKQVGKGMNLESYANLNLKPQPDTLLDKIRKKVAGNLERVAGHA